MTLLRRVLRRLVAERHATCLTILSLAAGLTVVSVAVLVVDSIAVNGLPFRNLDRLTVVSGAPGPADRDRVQWLGSTGPFSAVAEYVTGTVSVRLAEPTKLRALQVSHSLLDTLGLTALSGRDFAPEDEQLGEASSVMISSGLARQLFGAPEAAVGSSIEVDGVVRTIIGVLPPRLNLIGKGDVWLPRNHYRFDLRSGPEHAVDGGVVLRGGMITRLADGWTMRAAAERVRAAQRAAEHAQSASSAKAVGTSNVSVRGLREVILRPVSAALVVLVVLSALILCVAVGDAAAVQCARAAINRRVVRLQLVLSAPVRRLLSESVVEATVIVVAAATLAVAGVASAIHWVGSWWATAIRDATYVVTSTWLLAMGSIAAAIVPIVAIPHFVVVWQERALRSPFGTLSKTPSTALNVIVAVQSALAVLLTVAAWSMTADLLEWRSGFAGLEISTQVAAAQVSFYDRRSPPPNSSALWSSISDSAALEASILQVGMVDYMPFTKPTAPQYWIEPQGGKTEGTTAVVSRIRGSFTRALGIRTLAGEALEPGRNPNENALHVAVSADLARLWWRTEQAAIGQVLTLNGVPNRIIGVVETIVAPDDDETARFQVYAPADATTPTGTATIVWRVRQGGTPTPHFIRRAIHALSSTTPQPEVQTTERIVEASARATSAVRRAAVVVAAIALWLLAIGVHSIVLRATVARVRDMGIRLALGATRREMVRVFAGPSIWATAVGILMGALAAVAAGSMSTIHDLYGRTEMRGLILVSIGIGAISIITATIPVMRRSSSQSIRVLNSAE